MSFSETVVMKVANLSPSGIDATLRRLAENEKIYQYINTITEKKLGGIEKLDRILVVSDTNIGDAVVIQSIIRVLKYYLPDCAIDYIYQQKAQPLIYNNPYIEHDLPIFIDANFTSTKNKASIEKLLVENEYDLVVNLYPFFSSGALNHAKCPILVPFKLVADIVINTKDSAAQTPHVLLQLYNYVTDLIYRLPAQLKPTATTLPFEDNKIYLRKTVFSNTDRLLKHLKIPSDAKIVFLNPDTSSQFTLVPFDFQLELIKKLLLLDRQDFILIGPGFTFKGIEHDLYNQIPPEINKNQLVVLPDDISISTYAGIIDQSDLFITGDTAQMHIAAAYKICPGSKISFRNKTALISIFGATDSKIYGYDSFSNAHLASSQDAPSKVFEGKPACKNITCIHKTHKNCMEVKCFEGIEVEEIIGFINSQLY